MSERCLAHHATWRPLLRINIQKANVTFEDAEHLTHEEGHHRWVEVLVVEGFGCQCVRRLQDLAILILESQCDTFAVWSLVEGIDLEGEDAEEWDDAAEYEESGEGWQFFKVRDEEQRWH